MVNLFVATVAVAAFGGFVVGWIFRGLEVPCGPDDPTEHGGWPL